MKNVEEMIEDVEKYTRLTFPKIVKEQLRRELLGERVGEDRPNI